MEVGRLPSAEHWIPERVLVVAGIAFAVTGARSKAGRAFTPEKQASICLRSGSACDLGCSPQRQDYLQTSQVPLDCGEAS